MTTISFPFKVATDGRTGAADINQHVKELIELVLFTSPGERVNRPEFGAGLRAKVFSENSPELAQATEHMVQSGLQRWLSELIEINEVNVMAREAVLAITVRFRLLNEAEERTVSINQKV